MPNRFYPMSELLAEVKDHAAKNYENGGWDIVVECYDDDAIKGILKGSRAEGTSRVRTPKSAIKRVAGVVGVVDSVRSDIQSA